eukprot:1485980-Karenia_brevis.AAC.1
MPGWTTVPTWITWMGNLHRLHYLDGQHITACITGMENLHCLDYLDGQPSLPGLLSLPGGPGWTTFTYLDLMI